MELQGKVALVTGGGTGVGRATALMLAKQGCSVAINYRKSQADAEKTASDIAALGASSVAIQADVADDDACRRLVESTVNQFGRLDVLVNNAGVTRFIAHADLERVTTEIWDELFATNVRGPFQCVRAAREHLKEFGGAVVNVASIAGLRGAGSSIPYCASKAALINMTMSLARSLAPHIRVNAVAPGFIEGRWLQEGLGTRYQMVKDRVEHVLPLGKVARAQDIAQAIMSLIMCDHITGQTLVCDGGMSIVDPVVLR